MSISLKSIALSILERKRDSLCKRLSWWSFIGVRSMPRHFPSRSCSSRTLALLLFVLALLSAEGPLRAQTSPPADTSVIVRGSGCGVAEVRKVYQNTRPPKANTDDQKD